MSSENPSVPPVPPTPGVPGPPDGVAPANVPAAVSGPPAALVPTTPQDAPVAAHEQPTAVPPVAAAPAPGYASDQQQSAQQPPATQADVPGATLPPAGPSAFRETLLTLRDLPLTVWRGDSVGALALPGTIRTRTGNGWMWWVTVFAGAGLLLGIIAATSLAKAVKTTAGIFDNAFGSLTGGLSSGYISASASVPFGTLLGMVVSVTVAVFVVGVIRALALGWTLRMRGVVVPFSTTADLAATGWGVGLLPVAIFTVLNFLPGAGLAAVLTFVAMLFYVPFTIVSEGLLYIGLNRLAPHASKSLLVPHAMLTLAAVALMLLAVFLINVVIVGSIA
ncbi:hypothetical protein IGS67_13390 [Flavimobilis sp. GY10621]|uniref:Yip1 domain-containing protein n=1 Tax=Flavimobilis rhizosphaerae TaxID=2775421 RepID=A0ABR9DWY0_9MICO|nr:hypothetical protein [Flavimobilis rhizosphaerae]MBD9700465.1 hypothetical protein [Flavimobilis rhizosphaerae]